MFKNNFLWVILLFITIFPVFPVQNGSRVFQVNPSEGIAAFNSSVAAAASGATIIVNEGSYIFTAGLAILNKKGITIEGKGNVEFLFNSSSKKGINIYNSSNITIRNIALRNRADKSMISTGTGIYLEKTGNILIEDCKLKNFAMGLYSADSTSVTIKACTIVNNNQWAVMGTFKKLNLIENDIEDNGGLFYINEENIHSIGIEQQNIYMKDNISISNGIGTNNFMPFPLLNSDKNPIPTPLSQELGYDQLMQQNTTDSFLQHEMIKNTELQNLRKEDQILENKDFFQNNKN